MGKLYVPYRMERWKDLQIRGEDNRIVSRRVLSEDEGSLGFLMAYDSLEALSRAYPGISPEEILTFEIKKR